ncbi:MAG TPA: GNAT family N-acetyltransferase [Longimicrobium sp.]|nr:GNAT family N-acetyltransferase [Longimicrobium sp.]
MQSNVQLRRLEAGDVDPIVAAFDALGWDKPRRQYERYLAEQAEGRRVVLVAVESGRILGYGTVVWESGYPPFREDGVPEIQDLNVFPEFRRGGVATLILEEAERLVGERSPVVGIGFGLYADYGTAQRLYVRRGYVPDGRGVSYRGHPVLGGETVKVDDHLALYLRKQLAGE